MSTYEQGHKDGLSDVLLGRVRDLHDVLRRGDDYYDGYADAMAGM